MKELSLREARNIVDPGNTNPSKRIPNWFMPDMIKYLFPIDQRPVTVPIVTPPGSPGERTSTRRDEDEARRKAMHSLVTSWDKSARSIAKQLVDVLFRGYSPGPGRTGACFGTLCAADRVHLTRFASLIPDSDVDISSVLASLSKPVPQLSPAYSVGGYTVTETVGPLAMLSRVCKYKERVTVWTKEKVAVSHGRRRAQIRRREGRIVLFDRQMNIVFIPDGNPADNWQFIRGHVIVLVQRSGGQRQLQSSPSSSSSSL